MVTSVTLAFYNVLAAGEGQQIARQTLNTTASHLQQARSRHQAGSGTRTDVLRWEARHAADRQSVVNATQQLGVARVRLNNLLGQALDAPLQLDPPPRAGASASPRSPGHAKLSATHPQLRLAQLNVESRTLERGSTRAAFLPTLDLTASYSWQRYLPHEELSSSSGWLGSYNAGLTLQVPIFDSATKVFRTRQASRELSRARLDQRNTRRLLQERLMQANLAAQSSYKNIAVAREQLAAADAVNDEHAELEAADRLPLTAG